MLNPLRSLFRRPAARPRAALRLESLEGREVPAVVYGLTSANTLIRLDSASPTGAAAPVAITGLQSTTEHVVGIDYRPRTGQLFATTVTTGSTTGATVNTYTINPLTGAATFVGTIPGTVTGAADVAGGYDFNPTVDRVRVVNVNGENYRINPNTGALAGDDTNLTFVPTATGPIIGIAYDRNFDRATATIPTTLYGIDRGTSSLVLIGGVNGTPSPNLGVVTTVGSLGVTLDAGSDAGFDIIPTFAGGTPGAALAALTVGGVTGLYSINLTTGAATLIGNVGNGGTQVTSLAAVPESVLVVGSGLGANGDVRILDASTGALRTAVVPFAGFQGGVRVAAGDVSGDGVPDAVVSAIAPQGHVKVFDGRTGAEVYSFFAFEGFAGTVNVASGDINGDGFDDIIVAANGVNGHVKVFSGKDRSLLASFLAYDGFGGNVTVAAADFDLDGKAEVVTAAAANGHVKVFGPTGALFTSASLPGFANSFFTYDGFLGGVFVAAGDLNGDGVPDIVTATGSPTSGHVKAFSGKDNSLLASFLASRVTVGPIPTQIATLGAVGVADVNGDGTYEIVVTPGEPGGGFRGAQANVTAFDLTGAPVGNTITAFANFLGGATVSGLRE